MSKCSISDSQSSLEFYKNVGYDGVFVTNHFGFKNVGKDGITYESKINTFFDDEQDFIRKFRAGKLSIFCEKIH